MSRVFLAVVIYVLASRLEVGVGQLPPSGSFFPALFSRTCTAKEFALFGVALTSSRVNVSCELGGLFRPSTNEIYVYPEPYLCDTFRPPKPN